jgi:hypothetical protein
MDLQVSYRGKPLQLPAALPADATLAQLSALIEQASGIDAAGQKLLCRGSKLAPPPLPLHAEGTGAGSTPLTSLGVQPGDKIMLVGADAESRRQMAQSLVAAEATAEARRAAQQAQRLKRFRASGRGGGSGAGAPPSAGCFQQLRVLRGHAPDARGRLCQLDTPPPEAAMELLQRLASDRGVVAIMKQRGWRVGLLAEFPPADGAVGVDNGCLLGFNKNRGQEIGLRLRTDRLDGLRPFEVIMKTLLHELTHMVHDDHNVHFRELNSQLARERIALDWTRSAGAVAGGGGDNDDDDDDDHGAPVRSEVWTTAEEDAQLFEGGSGVAGGSARHRRSGADHRALMAAAAAGRMTRRRPAEAAREVGSIVDLGDGGGGGGGAAPAVGEAPAVAGAAPPLPWESTPPPAAAEHDAEAEAAPTVVAGAEVGPRSDDDDGDDDDDGGGDDEEAEAELADALALSLREASAAPAAAIAAGDSGGGVDADGGAARMACVPTMAAPPAGAGGVRYAAARAELEAMGFSAALARRACETTGGELQAGAVWAMAHATDDHEDEGEDEGHGTVRGSTGAAAAAAATAVSAPPSQAPPPPLPLGEGKGEGGGEVEMAIEASLDTLVSFNERAEAVRLLRTLRGCLGRCLEQPAEPRWRSLNLAKPAVRAKLGGPGARAVLEMAGFRADGGGGGGGGGAAAGAGAAGGAAAGDRLTLRRDDPGLLWMVHTAVQSRLEEALAE